MERRRRVLIVDDEPNIVLSLEFLLQQQGYEVSVARDGEAALAAAEERRPDLVVLDVMLPDMDGFTVTRKLRDTGRQLPIVFVTARDSVVLLTWTTVALSPFFATAAVLDSSLVLIRRSPGLM